MANLTDHRMPALPPESARLRRELPILFVQVALPFLWIRSDRRSLKRNELVEPAPRYISSLHGGGEQRPGILQFGQRNRSAQHGKRDVLWDRLRWLPDLGTTAGADSCIADSRCDHE